MQKRKTKTSLTDEEWEQVIKDTFYAISIDETLDKIGMLRVEFNKYLKTNPDKKAEYEQARIDACQFLENDLINVHKKFKDAKQAKQYSDNLLKMLQAIQPEKYGNKLDLKMDQTISIQSAIDNADKRLAAAMRDVTPTVITSTIVPQLGENKDANSE